MAKKDSKTVWEKNFAGDTEIQDKVRSIFLDKVKGVQRQRQTYEEELLRYYNMWNVEHDEYHMYTGRSKLYIPEVRKNVEAQARQITENAFPSSEFFDCSPGETGTYKGANIQKAIRHWQLHQANIKSKFFVFVRQSVLFGTSPARVSWNKEFEWAYANARNKKTGKVEMTKKMIELYNGPTFETRDLLKWYPMNNKKMDFRQDGCFENQMVTQDYINRLEKMGMIWKKEEIYANMTEATALEEMDKDIRRMETLDLPIAGDTGYAGTASLRDEDSDSMGLALEQIIYAKLVAPKMCLPDEDPDHPIPVEIRIYNGKHVGFVGRNRFWHQTPPYLVGRYIYPNADEFYGQGMPKATQYQQYELNSKAEQCMDSVTLALNPIAVIDPAHAAQNAEFEVEPAAIWFANPAGVRLEKMPDVSGTGYAAIGQLRGQIQDYSDRAPALPDQLSGKSRSATQSEIVDRAMSIDQKHFQMMMEKDVLEPMMEMWESLTDQYAEERQMIMILGRDASTWKRMSVGKEMYLGKYHYFWKAMSDMSNKQIKSRQMIDMMKVAGSLPPDAQQKLNFNFAEAFRVLWKDIMNLPDGEKVIPDPNSEPSQDPVIVSQMIRMGLESEILPADDNAAFVKYFTIQAQEEKDKDIQQEFMRQIALHMQHFKVKRETMQQQMQMRQQMMLAQAQGGKPQGSGTQGSGNRTQLSPNANAGDMGSGVRA